MNYLVTYLTKSIADCHEPATTTAEQHARRLADELRWTPCSPRCSNWLLYGIQPAGAHPDMLPGCCPAKAHKAATLGYAGRRCLVSRKWTGKTLDQHRAERREHVVRTLGAVGIRAELGVSRSTFYEWRAKGRAPRCIKLPNGDLRIRRAELERWLDSREEVA